jgi:uncharacterized protein
LSRLPFRLPPKSTFVVLLFPLAVCLLAAARAQVPATATTTGSDAAWQQNVLDWRAAREREISAPDGWLTLVGLDWLKSGVNTVGAAADCSIRLKGRAPDHLGLITVSGKAVQLLAPSGGFPEGLLVDGAAAREGLLTIDDLKPSTIVWQGLTLVVLDRGGRFVLRTKDAASPTRTSFQGLHWYAPDPQYRVVAKWTPFAQPSVERIPTVIGTTLDMPSPGVAAFLLDGKPYVLQPVIEAGEDDKLFFILRDETSHTTTYGAGRFLHTGLPSNGLSKPGELILDFNELYNPPCAYTPYATCPLPPEQNRLPIAVPAGEQRYLP